MVGHVAACWLEAGKVRTHGKPDKLRKTQSRPTNFDKNSFLSSLNRLMVFGLVTGVLSGLLAIYRALLPDSQPREITKTNADIEDFFF